MGMSLFLVVFPMLTPAFPRLPLPWLAPSVAQAAEIMNSPEYLSVAVLPNGQVGAVFFNDLGGGFSETRFKRYFVESGLEPSQQLSTAATAYPQLAAFKGSTIAAYVSGANQFQLRFRVSADSGATWGAEYAPFGSETFDGNTGNVPLLLASRNGNTLYLFSCCVAGLAQYRSTTDATLATWSAASPAGDGTMHLVAGSECGFAGQECYRAHNFEFTELPSGQWLYIARSGDNDNVKCTRGTQVGTLGGSWSAQFNHGGGCNISGAGGESRATAFVDRSGSVYYLRAGEVGNYLYSKKSSDGGLTWGSQVQAYANVLDTYTVGSPVGLYVPGYSRGEYVWYAGFGGVGIGNTQNAVRVIPVWGTTMPYADTGTARLFGTLGGDYDFGTAYPYTFGRRDIPTGIGAYKTSAEDLAIPGRLLNLSFTRSYSSADLSISPLGPGWTHNLGWQVTDAGSFAAVRRGDGRQDTFISNGNG
ncbi:MAG: exo-alpha-sialidase, partial [Chloroflexi bacterium]